MAVAEEAAEMADTAAVVGTGYLQAVPPSEEEIPGEVGALAAAVDLVEEALADSAEETLVEGVPPVAGRHFARLILPVIWKQ